MFELFRKYSLSSTFSRKHSHGLKIVNLSTQNHVKFFSASTNKNFEPPKLTVLEKIAPMISTGVNLSNTAMIGVQHMLPSTASLFNAICHYLKINKENMYFAGKFYSSCPEVEDYLRKSGFHIIQTTKYPHRYGMYNLHVQEMMLGMWEKFVEHLEKNKNIRKIIVLDEGGYCTKIMPKHIPFEYEVTAIEQTRFGFYDKDIDSRMFTLIDVARSAAKKKLESPLIASSVTTRVNEIMKTLRMNKNRVCGIIGNGAIGSALAKHLLAQGYKVIVYDDNDSAFSEIYHRAFYRVESIKKVIASSDIVFGCTGRDISKDNDIPHFVNHSITLVSCSSQDIEYLSFLKKATQNDYFIEAINENLSQIRYINSDVWKVINILENGFPINFDRTPQSDPVIDMELTRCLLYWSVIQASFAAKKPIDDGYTVNTGCIEMLDPYVQRLIVKNWIKNQPQDRYPAEVIKCFNDIEWIKGNSGGEYKENNFIVEKLRQLAAYEEESNAANLRSVS